MDCMARYRLNEMVQKLQVPGGAKEVSGEHESNCQYCVLEGECGQGIRLCELPSRGPYKLDKKDEKKLFRGEQIRGGSVIITC